MNKAIEIKNLTKKYQNFSLKNISLNIPSGTIVGLIGENGAGKTTLIKSLLNIISIDSGTIKIFDKDYKQYEKEIKEDIGAVLDNAFFPETLTPKDINYILKDIYKSWDKDLFYQYLKQFNLQDNKPLKELSTGMRKKLEIATSLSHHPKLLILDEPTSGLDPVVRNEVIEILQDFIQDEEHTVMLSTHITTDLEHIADYIVFIDNGEIVLNKTRDDIFDNYAILKCDEELFKKIDKQDIIKYKKHKYNYEVLVSNKKIISKKYKEAVIDKITLEDLMVLMIKGEK